MKLRFGDVVQTDDGAFGIFAGVDWATGYLIVMERVITRSHVPPANVREVSAEESETYRRRLPEYTIEPEAQQEAGR